MHRQFSGFQGIPISFILIGINLLLFFLQQGSSMLGEQFALWPAGTPEQLPSRGGMVNVPQFQPWQLITYGFLHADFTHLFFNMFALYMFGLPMEQVWGKHRFAVYYMTCLVGAGFIQLIIASTGSDIYPTIGASGAVFGLLLAYGLRFPNNTIMLLIPPIPIKAKYFVLLYGIAELIFGVSGIMPGIAHFAHLGGMLFGFGLLWIWGWRPGR